jgi:hypothetical protein
VTKPLPEARIGPPLVELREEKREMVATRLWTFSVHAQSRGASRLNLLIDEKARAEISRQLDGHPTILFSGRRENINVYEIAVFKIRLVIVADFHRRVVITIIDAKRYFRRMKGIRGCRTDGSRRRDPVDDEFDFGDNHGSVSR